MSDSDNTTNTLVLKTPKPRAPLKDLNSLIPANDEENTAVLAARKRRVSFANVNKIVEFNSGAESLLVCQTPAYEEPFSSSSDSSSYRSSVMLKDVQENENVLISSTEYNIPVEYNHNMQNLHLNKQRYSLNGMVLAMSSKNNTEDNYLQYSESNKNREVSCKRRKSGNFLQNEIEFKENIMPNTSLPVRLSTNNVELTHTMGNQSFDSTNNMEFTEAIRNCVSSSSHCVPNSSRLSTGNMEITETVGSHMLEPSHSVKYSRRFSANDMELTEAVGNYEFFSSNMELTEAVGNYGSNFFERVPNSTRFSANDMELTEAISNSCQVPISPRTVLVSTEHSINNMELTEAIGKSSPKRLSMNNMELTEAIGNLNPNSPQAVFNSSELSTNNMEFTEAVGKTCLLQSYHSSLETEEIQNQLAESSDETRLTETRDEREFINKNFLNLTSHLGNDNIDFTETIKNPCLNTNQNVWNKTTLINNLELENTDQEVSACNSGISINTSGFKRNGQNNTGCSTNEMSLTGVPINEQNNSTDSKNVQLKRGSIGLNNITSKNTECIYDLSLNIVNNTRDQNTLISENMSMTEIMTKQHTLTDDMYCGAEENEMSCINGEMSMTQAVTNDVCNYKETESGKSVIDVQCDIDCNKSFKIKCTNIGNISCDENKGTGSNTNLSDSLPSEKPCNLTRVNNTNEERELAKCMLNGDYVNTFGKELSNRSGRSYVKVNSEDVVDNNVSYKDDSFRSETNASLQRNDIVINNMSNIREFSSSVKNKNFIEVINDSDMNGGAVNKDVSIERRMLLEVGGQSCSEHIKTYVETESNDVDHPTYVINKRLLCWQMLDKVQQNESETLKSSFSDNITFRRKNNRVDEDSNTARATEIKTKRCDFSDPNTSVTNKLILKPNLIDANKLSCELKEDELKNIADANNTFNEIVEHTEVTDKLIGRVNVSKSHNFIPDESNEVYHCEDNAVSSNDMRYDESLMNKNTEIDHEVASSDITKTIRSVQGNQFQRFVQSTDDSHSSSLRFGNDSENIPLEKADDGNVSDCSIESLCLLDSIRFEEESMWSGKVWLNVKDIASQNSSEGKNSPVIAQKRKLLQIEQEEGEGQIMKEHPVDNNFKSETNEISRKMLCTRENAYMDILESEAVSFSTSPMKESSTGNDINLSRDSCCADASLNRVELAANSQTFNKDNSVCRSNDLPQSEEISLPSNVFSSVNNRESCSDPEEAKEKQKNNDTSGEKLFSRPENKNNAEKLMLSRKILRKTELFRKPCGINERLSLQVNMDTRKQKYEPRLSCVRKTLTSKLHSFQAAIRNKYAVKELSHGVWSLELLPGLLYMLMHGDDITDYFTSITLEEHNKGCETPWNRYAVDSVKQELSLQLTSSLYSPAGIVGILDRTEPYLLQTIQFAKELRSLCAFHCAQITNNILSLDLIPLASPCWIKINIDITSRDAKANDISVTNVIGDVKQSKIRNLYKDVEPGENRLLRFIEEIRTNPTKLN